MHRDCLGGAATGMHLRVDILDKPNVSFEKFRYPSDSLAVTPHI